MKESRESSPPRILSILSLNGWRLIQDQHPHLRSSTLPVPPRPASSTRTCARTYLKEHGERGDPAPGFDAFI